MDVDLSEEGLAKLAKAFNELPRELSVEVQARSLEAAAKVVQQEAKATTAFQDKSGRLRKSIKVQRRIAKFKKPDGQVFKVSGGEVVARATDAKSHLIEGGHKGPRPAPPHPFLAPAAEASQQQAFAAAVAEAQRRLPEAVRKAKLAGDKAGS